MQRVYAADSNYFALLKQDNLDNPVLLKFAPHIYMILSRKKVVLPNQCIKKENPQVDIEIEGVKRIFKYKLVTKEGACEMKSNILLTTENNSFSLKYEDGEEIQNGQIHLLMNQWTYDGIIDEKTAKQMKWDVLYVGQAKGRNGDRMAMDRLEDHSTLQKIYFEKSENYPNQDIWLLLLSFDHGRFNGSRIYSKDDAVDEQAINIIEGALIKYFDPKYNHQLKNTFPNPNHQSYRSFYTAGYSAINVVCTLEHTDINFATYIGTKQTGYEKSHIIRYTLQDGVEDKQDLKRMHVHLTKPLFGL